MPPVACARGSSSLVAEQRRRLADMGAVLGIGRAGVGAEEGIEVGMVMEVGVVGKGKCFTSLVIL